MDDSPHVAVIVNPVAGRGRGASVWPRVRAVFDAAGVRWSLESTTGPGHAAQLASDAACACVRTLVVVGGDGTVNEVVNGLLADVDSGAETSGKGGGVSTASRPTLGVIPVGTGNDFAKPLGLPTARPEDAAHVVLAGRTRTVDVGRVNGRCFVNGVGLGLDGYVAVETRRTRRLRGTAMYAAALVRALRTYRNATMRIDIDGRVETRSVTMVNVTNGPCHGGGFWICPHARVDDGLLDLCIADAMPARRVVPLALRVMRGAHVGQPGISFATGRYVTIASDVPLPAHVDGEILGTALSELAIEILPGALRVLVPR